MINEPVLELTQPMGDKLNSTNNMLLVVKEEI